MTTTRVSDDLLVSSDVLNYPPVGTEQLLNFRAHNGKPVYRQSFTGNTTASNSGRTSVVHSIGIDFYLWEKCGGDVEAGIGGDVFGRSTIGGSNSGGDNEIGFINSGLNEVGIEHRASDARYNNRNYFITIYYTKAADTTSSPTA